MTEQPRGIPFRPDPLALRSDARIAGAIEAERERTHAIVAGVVAAERERTAAILTGLLVEIRREGKRALDELREIGAEHAEAQAQVAAEREAAIGKLTDELHSVRIDLADTRGQVAELREALAAERGRALDLPNPLRRRDHLN
jgi:hypothetical protein